MKITNRSQVIRIVVAVVVIAGVAVITTPTNTLTTYWERSRRALRR